jgi:hypothetical protein
MNTGLRVDPIVLVAAVVGAIGLGTSPVLYAADYLTIAQAQKVMFPDATGFAPVTLNLTNEQINLIKSHAGPGLRASAISAWRAQMGASTLGFVVSDSVIGKFELIDYAVAFGPDAAIRDVEILSYRETHGGEVRNGGWRGQFQGKSSQAPLVVGNDIDNISGATLSCTHLTDGIRRLASLAELALIHD